MRGGCGTTMVTVMHNLLLSFFSFYFIRRLVHKARHRSLNGLRVAGQQRIRGFIHSRERTAHAPRKEEKKVNWIGLVISRTHYLLHKKLKHHHNDHASS